MAQLFLAKPVSPREIEEKHFAEERPSFADALRSARSIAQRLESTNQFNTEATEIAEKPVIKMHFSVALWPLRFFYSIRLARRVYSSSASRNFFLPSQRGDSFCLF